MSVPKSRRKQSPFEVLHNAREIRKWLNDWCLRDFGLKDESFPKWYVEKSRDEVRDLVHRLKNNIVAANAINPETLDEVDLRRRYNDVAIANCYELLEEIDDITSTLKIPLGGITQVMVQLRQEVFLLKGWRKLTNKMRKAIECKKNMVSV